MKFKFTFLSLIYFLSTNILSSIGEKILVVIVLGSKSHKNAYEPLFHELGSRGHQVTVLSIFKPSKNYTSVVEINPITFDDISLDLENPFDLRLKGSTLKAFDLAHVCEFICTKFYEDHSVKELMQEKVDLIIMNTFMSECAYGFVHHFKTKLMFFSSMPILSWQHSSFGGPTLPSINPFFFYDYTDEMNFIERMYNFAGHTKYNFIRNYIYIPRMETLYKKYFPTAPSALELENQFSLILTNSHPSFNFPRPYFPYIIETGGLHCFENSSNDLPDDLKEFLDGSGKDGVIYFSMGSFLKSSDMPKKFLHAFTQTFASLKQRVIWKFEAELEGLPKNVLVKKWLPQQNVLSHPKTRLFITHGGLLSVQEAVYNGVPLLGIPLFADQDSNMKLATKRGFALKVELESITQEVLTKSITQILNDNRFKQKAKQLEFSFKDRPENPLETAVFWTEFVLRHNESIFYSPARDMNFIQFYSIDVVSVYVLLFSIGLIILGMVISNLYKLIFNRVSAKPKSKVVKKNKKSK